MPARKPGRYLALLALVAVIVTTSLVVRTGLRTTPHATTTRATQLPSTHRVVLRRRFYVVRAGDTLSNISVKTDVPVAQLQALNPALASDPNALQTGQRLRLR